MTLALVVGSALHQSPIAHRGRTVVYDEVGLIERDGFVVLPRHGLGTFNLPHRIDHVANLAALVAAGADRILSVSSVGSLRVEHPVGSVVLVDDFYPPTVNVSQFGDARAHQVPGFDREWSAAVATTWRARAESPLVEGGVYAQTTGPRFETPAEVRALARIADVVGMTVASECILASERGIPYASVCVVDNFANGIGPEMLSIDEYRAGVVANLGRLIADLEAVVPALAGVR